MASTSRSNDYLARDRRPRRHFYSQKCTLQACPDWPIGTGRDIITYVLRWRYNTDVDGVLEVGGQSAVSRFLQLVLVKREVQQIVVHLAIVGVRVARVPSCHGLSRWRWVCWGRLLRECNHVVVTLRQSFDNEIIITICCSCEARDPNFPGFALFLKPALRVCVCVRVCAEGGGQHSMVHHLHAIPDILRGEPATHCYSHRILPAEITRGEPIKGLERGLQIICVLFGEIDQILIDRSGFFKSTVVYARVSNSRLRGWRPLGLALNPNLVCQTYLLQKTGIPTSFPFFPRSWRHQLNAELTNRYLDAPFSLSKSLCIVTRV